MTTTRLTMTAYVLCRIIIIIITNTVKQNNYKGKRIQLQIDSIQTSAVKTMPPFYWMSAFKGIK